MKILVIGSGGREHALCLALAQCESRPEVICAPGNDGIARQFRTISLSQPTDIISFCQQEAIDWVMIGPEQPLVDGVSDALREAGIAVLGPSKAAAQLEASKAFTKALCDRMQIPTAAYAAFDNETEALDYLATQQAPIVIKADGLAAGKGVTVAEHMDEAVAAVTDCFAGRFGAAGARVVIEECLMGEEISFFALCHGTQAMALGSAQDHKRIGEGDTGANTGGMGTYSPAPAMNAALQAEIMQDIIEPALQGMAEAGTPYQGILFAGLMLTAQGPKLIEFNCRFGDPETQVLLPRLQGDMAELLGQVAHDKWPEKSSLSLSDDSVICVVLAAPGYPENAQKGSIIHGLDRVQNSTGAQWLHAGTKLVDGQWQAQGGRVLNVVARAATLQQAASQAYESIALIDWPEAQFRRDIGWRALQQKVG